MARHVGGTGRGDRLAWVVAALVFVVGVLVAGVPAAAQEDPEAAGSEEDQAEGEAAKIFEVSEYDAHKALKAAEKGANRVREKENEKALEQYLFALGLDPYNSLARYGLAALAGPIARPAADWPPAAPPKEAIKTMVAADVKRDLPPAGAPLFETSPDTVVKAEKEALRGAGKERDRKSRAAYEHYLAALGLDPYNSLARAGVASLTGSFDMPIGSWPPAPETTVAVAPPGPAPAGDEAKSRGREAPPAPAADVVPAIITSGTAVIGNPRAEIRERGPYYEQAKPYLGRIKDAAETHGIDPRLILAIIKVESNFSPRARSSRGAFGLMQLMPKTAAKFGAKSVDDESQNIEAGTRYLRYLLEVFRGDLDRALAAWNMGEMTVVKHRSVPPHPAVRRFIRDVRAAFQKF